MNFKFPHRTKKFPAKTQNHSTNFELKKLTSITAQGKEIPHI